MASGLGADERGDLGLEPLQGGTRGIYASGVDGKWAECDILITIPSRKSKTSPIKIGTRRSRVTTLIEDECYFCDVDRLKSQSTKGYDQRENQRHTGSRRTGNRSTKQRHF